MVTGPPISDNLDINNYAFEFFLCAFQYDPIVLDLLIYMDVAVVSPLKSLLIEYVTMPEVFPMVYSLKEKYIPMCHAEVKQRWDQADETDPPFGKRIAAEVLFYMDYTFVRNIYNREFMLTRSREQVYAGCIRYLAKRRRFFEKLNTENKTDNYDLLLSILKTDFTNLTF